MQYDFIYMWNLKNKMKDKQNKIHRYREQNGGCQRGRQMSKMDEEGRKVQTSSYKICHGDAVYTMLTIVSNQIRSDQLLSRVRLFATP